MTILLGMIKNKNKDGHTYYQIMRLTESIQIKSSENISKLCHLAKNLYNIANWYYRQEFEGFGLIPQIMCHGIHDAVIRNQPIPMVSR